MLENTQNPGRDQNQNDQRDEMMNEQNLSRDQQGRTQDVNQPSEPGGRSEAWQNRTEDISDETTDHTAGDKRKDQDLTQRNPDSGSSEGRDQMDRGR